ncbi:MAG: Ig-like domain-containing protein [Clostridia bacterium]|nr:Ig-like domain-containing protein [Clostridia bacterium]
MFKKVLSLAMVLAMVLGTFSVLQVAAATFDAEYNFNDTTVVFDPSADSTDAFHHHGQVPTYSYDAGFSGAEGDSALKMSIGEENQERQGYLNFFGVRNEYGFSVRADSADATVSNAVGNATYALNANFKATHKDVIAALIYPGTSNGSPSYGNVYKNSVIYLYNGKLYVGTDGNFEPETDKCIAEPGVGNWFTLGAVFSTTHKRFDVFYNGKRIYGETRSAYASGVNRWHVYMHSANETKHAPYNAGEFLYVDNLYAGQDFTKIKGYFPEVVSVSPAKDADDVPTNAKVTFDFSVPVRTDSNGISKAITVSPTAEYTLEYVNDNQTMTISFTNGLQPDTTYTVSLFYRYFQSFMYEAAKAGFSTTFKTAKFAADDLYVTGVTPSKDATNVPVNTSEIKVNFSQPVNKESAAGKIKLSPDFDISLGEYSWNEAATELTIPVNGELYGNSEYTVILGNGILSTGNKALVGDSRFTFTTGEGEYLFHQGFEALEGSLPVTVFNKGMNASNAKTFTVLNDEVQGNYGEFRVEGDWAQHDLYPQLNDVTPGIEAGKTVSVGFKVRFKNEPMDPTRNDLSVIQYNRDGQNDLNLIDYDKATKRFIARNGVDVVGNYVANEWLEFGMVYNLEKELVDIYYNGEKVIKGLPLDSLYAGNGLARITFRPFNARADKNYPLAETPSIYDIDDITWSYDPYLFESDLELKNSSEQQNINVSDLITLDFNNAVMTEGIAEAISVTYDNGTVATIKNAHIFNSGKTVRIELDGGLLPNKAYKVTIDADKMKSEAGKAFAGNNEANFLVGEKSYQLDVKFYRGLFKLPATNTVSDEMTVQATVALMEDNAQIVIARYNGNTLMALEAAEPITNGTSAASTTFTKTLKGCNATDTIKVFCWNGKAMPVVNAVQLLPVN